jgi:DNA polymerase
MKPDRDLILREMGLGPVWRLRAPAAAVPAGQGASATTADAGQAQATAPAAVPAAAPSALAPLAAMAWDELAATVAACRQCRLCEVRKQAVLGVGDRNADWLFVGEGPGAEEDARGEPFVGQAGKLLDNMLAAIGLRRGEDVYIANAVKCRPPENRTPTPEETALCRPYLERQIELLRPRLIVALGRPAAQTLLQDDVKIGAARGKLHDYRGIPLIVSYHPAYLLRTPQDKARAWEDLCFMRRTMRTQKDR